MSRLLTTAAVALGLTTTAYAAGADKSEKLQLPLEGDNVAAVMHALPSNEQMQLEYPPIALAMDLKGSATITCTIQTDGRLGDCQVDDQSPAGLGFGAAALRLSAYFAFTPPTFDGRPVKRKVTIPIHFQLGDVGRPPPPPEQVSPPTSPAALVLAREVVALRGDAAQLRIVAAVITERLTMQVVADDEPAAGERIADAYRLGVEDVIAEESETRARLLAAAMTADQLRTTLAYLDTPAGAAYRTVTAHIEDPNRTNFWARIATAAKAHLCDPGVCPAGGASAPAPAS